MIFVKYLGKAGSGIGHNVLEPHFKKSPMTIFVALWIFGGCWSCIYTIIASDMKTKLQCAGISGFVFQVNRIIKIVIIILLIGINIYIINVTQFVRDLI